MRQAANITLNSVGIFAQFSRKRSERKLDEDRAHRRVRLSNEMAAKVNGSSRFRVINVIINIAGCEQKEKDAFYAHEPSAANKALS